MPSPDLTQRQETVQGKQKIKRARIIPHKRRLLPATPSQKTRIHKTINPSAIPAKIQLRRPVFSSLEPNNEENEEKYDIDDRTIQTVEFDSSLAPQPFLEPELVQRRIAEERKRKEEDDDNNDVDDDDDKRQGESSLTAQLSTEREKRKASTDAVPSAKKSNTSRPSNLNDINSPHPSAQQAEQFGIVLRDFYPPEMSNARCEAYNNGTLERPIDTLNRAYEETNEVRGSINGKNAAVVHWFKNDLRLKDNRALKMAYDLAQANNAPLICLYILSPQDLTAHLASPARVDFVLRNLKVLKIDLEKLDIPLYMETQEKRRTVPNRILELCEQWGVNHLFANIEYEVDELRREAKLVRLLADKGIVFETAHDSCVVTPGALQSQQGKQYAVFSPWYRSWMNYLHQHEQNLTVLEAPGANSSSARSQFADLFDSQVPDAPANKRLGKEEKQRFSKMYPEGESEAMRRLDRFLKTKANDYNKVRSMVDNEYTSVLSPYLAAGVLSARTAVSIAKDANGGYLDGKNAGLASWISEVAWRDFYKHVLVHWPFICTKSMNKCFKPEFTNVEWEYDSEIFTRWTEGQTGVPLVDAAMRQLKHDAWMHNRNRMVVSSFLSKDLMIDWRRGERHFMENLVDGDFASNHGGWGFGSSTGVDPQPYFRIFNPLLQSEKSDPNGEYIRKWVPELRDIKDRKAIHDPYNRGAAAVAQKAGYPRAIVEHAASRARALQRYKEGIAR
ncbi:Deoxyribodipyrimidine photo-lyase [Talaromyces atroroseus]|uniref:Deoxyribodipyrimidine photo-lyase n=1 Tax=Talaromyces atroroseus TaxID=1441469 RepID=A0A225APR3_TALAT|nr:Deoxyribodipyrimidine photo-lyase [Talaromyces atroroseus]OKL63611.1 Deoxyribodipyrimidine photo-lyase [Talaromyces atroroseus]